MSDINKLIADAKAAQAEARAQAVANAKEAAKNKAEAQVAALSKKQLQYADSLKPTLNQFEAQLRIFANKIARGDKLSAVEQKEFNKLQADYKSVNDTIDAAIKKANDIVVEARRGTSTQTTVEKPLATAKESIAPKVAQSTPESLTPTKKTTSSGSPTKVVPSDFNVGTFRAADEASMAKADGVTPASTDPFKVAAEKYAAIDTIFKTNPELTALVTKAVKEGWTTDRWSSELANTTWYKSNSSSLQQRGFYKRQYNELVNAISENDPERQSKIDALQSSTTYGRGLAAAKRLIQAEAIAEGAVIDNAALDLLAQDIYDNALETDGLAIRNYVKAKIKYTPGSILSGKAGQDLAELKGTAAANGINLDQAFGSSLQGWLQKLAAGESVDTYKNIIRQTAKLGMPERVGSLLDNGVDLETIYSPYKNLMANTLEINPQTITLSDPVLRSAITGQGETSLYDFARNLRKDNRWQYTNQARDEVSQGVQKVLQDFGFQG